MQVDDRLNKLEKTVQQLLEKVSLNENRMEASTVEELTKKIHKTTITTNVNRIIKLNIGGTVFTTTLETLTSEKETYFGALFSELFEIEQESDGTYFVDRDPTYFHLILNHLRGVNVSSAVKSLDQPAKDLLAQEISFYSVVSMFSLLPRHFKDYLHQNGYFPPIKFDTAFCSSKCAFYNDNTRIKKNTTESGWDCSALGDRSVERFSVRLISNCTYLMIGMAPKTITKESHNHTTCGWYFYCCDGKLWSQDSADRGRDYLNSASYHEGTIIDVFYENGELSFTVNGRELGVAYRRLPEGLYPAFDLNNAQCEFEFIND